MILIKDVDLIATFNQEDQVIQGGSLLLDGPRIVQIGAIPELEASPELVIDGHGKIALPGFVNTHHHFFQQLTRAVPEVHCTNILQWLEHLYPIWGRMDEEAMYYAALLSCAELLLTGCTTTSDMGYFYPDGKTNLFDVTVRAAREIGIRFHPCRASMPSMEANLAEKLEGAGISSKNLIEEPDDILDECRRVIDRYHEPGEFSMCVVSIGQTDKTYLEPNFMRQMADLAREYGVMLHTHLHPRLDEVALCKELYNLEPIDFLDEHGWLGEDVWFAHATSFSPYYVDRVTQTRTGISHSPSSNMRLNYAFAPIPALVKAGAKVSVAVDGGASNDSGDFLGELREVLLTHRISGLHPEPFNSAGNTTPYGVLKLGAWGGAQVLNRNDIGSLEVGKAADIALFNLNRIDYAASHDPLGALLLCGISHRVDTTIVNGKIVVENSRLVGIGEEQIAQGANRAAKALMMH